MLPNNSPVPSENWKRKTYILGSLAGTVFGLMGAYLYARAAEEDAMRNGGKPNSVPTGQLMTLLLAVIAVMRQITELGKSPKK